MNQILLLALIIVALSSLSCDFVTGSKATLNLPQQWYYLGPLLHSKIEYDFGLSHGDESQQQHTLEKYFSRRNSKSFRVRSETSPQGYISWKAAQMQFSESGPSSSSRHFGELGVDHQRELLQVKQHLQEDEAVLEFVGFAVAELRISESRVYSFHAQNVHTIYFNETPASTDQFGRGFVTSVFLEKSEYPVRISVKLRGRAASGFRLRSLPPSNNRVTGGGEKVKLTKHNFAPDLVFFKGEEESGGADFYLGSPFTVVSFVIQSKIDNEALKNIQASLASTSSLSWLKILDTKEDEEYSLLCGDNNNNNEKDESDEEQRILCNNLYSRRKVNDNNDDDFNNINLPPMHTRTVSLSVEVTDKKQALEACKMAKRKNRDNPEVSFQIRVFSQQKELGKLTFSFRCRDARSQTFVVTYRDFDGSPMQAGISLPLEREQEEEEEEEEKEPSSADSSSSSSNLFPVLLTLHGTGVAVTSSVDSYKFKNSPSDRDFTFGSSGFFVIAPSRHGAHDWQSVGKISALYSLFFISRAVLVNSQIRKREEERRKSSQESSSSSSSSSFLDRFIPDSSRFSSHGSSMGAHGALQLAQHHPSRILGLNAHGLWVREQDYSSSNKVFHLDRAVDSRAGSGILKHILESSIAECYGLSLENTLQFPVFLRTGGQDQTASPFFARRIARILKTDLGHNNNLTYSEPPRASHWEWSLNSRDDGGIVFDVKIRTWLQNLLSGSKKSSSSSSSRFSQASIEKLLLTYPPLQEKEQEQEENDKKRKKILLDVFVTWNIHSSWRSRNIIILEQQVPYERSEVLLFENENDANEQQKDENEIPFFYSRNVKKLKFDFSSSCKDSNNKNVNQCFEKDQKTGKWSSCSSSSSCSSAYSSSQCGGEQDEEQEEHQVHHEGFPLKKSPKGRCFSPPSKITGRRTRSSQKFFGPIRALHEAPSAISYFSEEEGKKQQQLREKIGTRSIDSIARWFAESSLVAYDTDIPIFKNKIHPTRRTLLLASLNEYSSSSYYSKLLDDFLTSRFYNFKVTITPNFIEIDGNRIFGKNLVFVSCFYGTRLTNLQENEQEEEKESYFRGGGGVVVISQTFSGLKHFVDIATPTVPPMMRAPLSLYLLPDFFVSNSDLAQTGLGSFVAAGHFNDDFTINSKKSFFLS